MGAMNTEILLARGETVTCFELPAAEPVKVVWPEPRQIKISGPRGLTFAFFNEHFSEILHPDLVSHLEKSWPEDKALRAEGKSVPVDAWDDVQIEISTKKNRKSKEVVELDRPRITIQMGQRVDEFADNCQKHFKPELFEHVVKLWSDPDYCRTVLPVGRNLLIRDCA